MMGIRDYLRNVYRALAGGDLSQRLQGMGSFDEGRQSLRLSPKYKWWVLGISQIAILMALLDASIVNIALPTILAALRTDLVTVEWVVIGYLLVITSFLLVFGRLGDMTGRKRVFVAGFLLFTLGSGLCGTSGTVWELIGFRLLQGLGAAMLLANNYAIITAVFPGTQRGLALGINGITAAAAVTIGPALGGFMVDYFGWGSIFYLNVPIGVFGAVAGTVILDEEAVSGRGRNREGRFDFLGAGISIVALTSLLIALNIGPEVGWTSAIVLGLTGLFVLFGAFFLFVESRVAQPMVDLALLRRQNVSAGLFARLLGFLGISANAFLMPFYLQVVLGYRPAIAGLLMSPTALVIMVVSPLSGWLSDRIGTRLLTTVGITIVAIALYLLSTLTVGSHYLYVLYWLLLLGFGWGIFQAPNNSSVMGAIPREQLGVGSGLLSLMRNIGLMVGVAASNAFLLSSIAQVAGRAGLGALELRQIHGEQYYDVLAAFVRGLQHAYLAAAFFAGIAIVVSFFRGGSFFPLHGRGHQ